MIGHKINDTKEALFFNELIVGMMKVIPFFIIFDLWKRQIKTGETSK
jgi:hypothetical protein